MNPLAGHSHHNDTIVAIATAPGEAAIGMVRLSGKNAFEIAGWMLAKGHKKEVSALLTHTVHFARLVDKNGQLIDQAMVTVLKAPQTYTKEDMVEVTCHGGMIPLRRTLEACLALGARLAEPGEFTKRAFLNGRIDLAQAEAVADIIQARTDLSLRTAVEQLEGSLSRNVKALRDTVLEVLAFVEAHIDFPEEDIDPLSLTAMEGKIDAALAGLDKLLQNAAQGRVLREGLLCAIVGKPNVGKSSLLNALLEQERAIVTDIPGTTRDVIEEVISVQGLPVRLMDTAGIHETGDTVEREGILRSRQALEKAGLVILVLDGSRNLDKEDKELFSILTNKIILIALNKQDLGAGLSDGQVSVLRNGSTIVRVSAKTGEGLDELKAKIAGQVLQGKSGLESVMVTNVRHQKALEDARQSLKHLKDGFRKKVFEEFLCVDLRAALDSLGAITGETTTDDLLDEIFSRFCIGK